MPISTATTFPSLLPTSHFHFQFSHIPLEGSQTLCKFQETILYCCSPHTLPCQAPQTGTSLSSSDPLLLHWQPSVSSLDSLSTSRFLISSIIAILNFLSLSPIQFQSNYISEQVDASTVKTSSCLTNFSAMFSFQDHCVSLVL